MTSKARNWRLWRIPTSGSMYYAIYAIPGLAYTTAEAAEEGLERWYPTGRDIWSKIVVADVNGYMRDGTFIGVKATVTS